MGAFDDYSLAKELVQSTIIAPDGTHVYNGNSVSQPLKPLLSSPTIPVQNSIPASSVSSRGNDQQALSEQFERWVSKLDNRVRELEGRIPSGEVRWLQKEADTCHSELQHLYTYAEQHDVGFASSVSQLRSIEARLHSIDFQLQQKKERIEQASQPLWVKVVRVVVKAIDLVSQILGLPQAFRNALSLVHKLLPGGNNPKLLK